MEYSVLTFDSSVAELIGLNVTFSKLNILVAENLLAACGWLMGDVNRRLVVLLPNNEYERSELRGSTLMDMNNRCIGLVDPLILRLGNQPMFTDTREQVIDIVGQLRQITAVPSETTL